MEEKKNKLIEYYKKVLHDNIKTRDRLYGHDKEMYAYFAARVEIIDEFIDDLRLKL